MIYKIKNWQDFQHYKDRAPPWIKLHNTLLTSEVWVMGNDATRALVVASMLLASRNNANDGTFNGDPEYIKRFAYLNSFPDFKPLIQYGFIELLQDASSVLASRNTEERREEEKRVDIAPGKPVAFNPKTHLETLGVDPVAAADWLVLRKLKKSASTITAFNGLEREAKKAGYTCDQAVRLCCERGWAGFKAEWVAGDKPTSFAETITAKPEEAQRSKEWAQFEYAVRSFRETVWPDGMEADRLRRAAEIQEIADSFGVTFERPLLEVAA